MCRYCLLWFNLSLSRHVCLQLPIAKDLKTGAGGTFNSFGKLSMPEESFPALVCMNVFDTILCVKSALTGYGSHDPANGRRNRENGVSMPLFTFAPDSR